ncbi:hypothetical protein DBR32_01860 [Taibaiella sp. KBW10]|uniref:L,D-transpeptidase family protein n=1 Tax=Taibaiella sp. KBW10 TaxID=2153357 RepID=UPI000F59EC5A|nr:L,D-transpeptidase family protein [Taibaiella sp. KBW10]RQO32374.1 hypothetical protein DBR32_01860 [Taibaiella sp. KBW10]
MKLRSLSKYPFFLAAFSMIYLLPSCNSDSGDNKGGILSGISDAFSSEVSKEAMTKALSAQYTQTSDSAASPAAQLRNISTQVKAVYEKNDHKPIWLKGDKFSDQASGFINSLEQLKWDGLDPEKYQLSRLKKCLSASKATEDSLARWDILFTEAYVGAARDLTFGLINPAEIDKEWHADNDSTFTVVDDLAKLGTDKSATDLKNYRPLNPRYALMQKELQKWNGLKSDTAYIKQKSIVSTGDMAAAQYIIKKEISSTATDTNLIKAYQYLNHLSANGKIDVETIKTLQRSPDDYVRLLKINMERLRWLPNTMAGQYIWVSIPQTEIDYYKNGNNLFHNRSVVGSRTTRTPTILKPMQNIVICPPWTLPLSIVGKEYGGRIPSYYEVYSGGKRVPNGVVNASNYRKYTVRQPAGPRAALGYVKFNLPNQWDIYLHDTPGRYVFANKSRYLSHGCVRVKDPRTLAALILEDKNIGIDSINTMIAKNRTKQIPTDLIPVYITYTTANADSAFQNIIYLNDPYKKDSVLVAKFK